LERQTLEEELKEEKTLNGHIKDLQRQVEEKDE
jgi:hypothetical protein